MVACAAPLNAQTADEHFARGDDLFRKGDYAHASAEAKRAIALDGDHVKAYWLLGWSSLQTKAYEEAITAFRKVIDARPEFSPPYALLRQAARARMTHATENAVARDMAAARSAVAQGKYRDAVRLLTDLTERHFGVARAHLVLAETYDKMGNAGGKARSLRVFHGFLRALLGEGDGRSPATAVRTVVSDDEDLFLEIRGCEATRREARTIQGTVYHALTARCRPGAADETFLFLPPPFGAAP